VVRVLGPQRKEEIAMDVLKRCRRILPVALLSGAFFLPRVAQGDCFTPATTCEACQCGLYGYWTDCSSYCSNAWCTPDCSCSASTPVGQVCYDGCGGYCAGNMQTVTCWDGSQVTDPDDCPVEPAEQQSLADDATQEATIQANTPVICSPTSYYHDRRLHTVCGHFVCAQGQVTCSVTICRGRPTSTLCTGLTG
jgi:hypothetical protein